MQHDKIKRIIQLLIALRTKQYCTADDLAKILGVARRTVFRDLKTIRTIGIPCRYSTKDHYYRIDPEFFMPASNLNTQEALALFLRAKLEGCIHLPFKNLAFHAISKVASQLPEQTSQHCSTALRNISINVFPFRKTASLDTMFTQLTKAIHKKQVVKIRHYLLNERKHVTSNLNPYHLRYADHTWHVIGKCSIENCIRTYKLSQIKKLEVLKQCFLKDNRFKIHDYLGKAWSMHPDCRLHAVKLEFRPTIAQEVAEIKWHKTQAVTFNTDGSAIIEFRVNGLDEIIWWVLGYGDNVKILAPKCLREKVIAIAESVIKQNSCIKK